MASKQPVWGIDVGQCSLKAVKLQAADDKVELLGFDIIDHEQILSQAEADAQEIARKSIETFASRNDLTNCRVVVSVPGQQTLTRFTKMPPVDAKKIPDMVQYEASQQIPFDMDEVVWDYQVFSEIESVEVEVGIFAIRKELIRNYLSMFTSQKVEPVMVQTSPMASYNAARFELPLPEGETYILLDMGAIATDLIVAQGSRIWSRPIPIGGNRFTEALVSAFKISFAKAEKLKRTAASSKYARQIFQAMRPVFADLVSEVQRSIGYYTSTHRDANITRIIGMGNAFKLPGLQKFLQQNVQMKVDKLPGFGRMIEVTNAKKGEFEENQVSLAVCYGLALQGLGLASVNSNLLPMEIRRTLLWQKKQPWFVASAACLALAAGSIWIGNVMAAGEVQNSIGTAQLGGQPRVGSVEEAERVLREASSAPSVERAQRVTAAAKYLKQEFGKYTSGSKEAGTLATLAKFPQNNTFVPMIVDIVHRAFEEVSAPELQNVKSPEEYGKLAARVPRSDRKEIWIDTLTMVYDEDPGRRFATGEGPYKRGRAGWAVEIKGTTTMPNPAAWIEEKLIRTLIEVGCKPGVGIYVDSVDVDKVNRRGKAGLPTASDSLGGEDDSGGGGGGRRTPGGRRATGGDDQGQDRRSGGFAGFGGPSGPPTRGGTPGVGTARSQLSDLVRDMLYKDPITKESVEDDYTFILQIIVRKDNTPNDRIPERYKEKKDDAAKPGDTPK